MEESTVVLADQTFQPLAGLALLWPQRRALLVADLHLEKATSYAPSGQLLPPYDSRDALDRLAGLMALHDIAEVWCLGDSLHDVEAARRMDEGCLEQVRQLSRRADWTWITGNHDPQVDAQLGGRSRPLAQVDGIMLRHEADRADLRPEISGHYHPKLWLRLRGRMIARRCFAQGVNKLILPAFGTLAGGLDVAGPELRAVLGPELTALVPSGTALRRYPMAQLNRTRLG